MYKLPVDQYKNLVKQNVTAEYRKTSTDAVTKVNIESASIATKLDIADRVDGYIEANAFVTIKDHKPAFPGRIECRLMNPAKSNMGKVSKQILDEAVAAIKSQTKSNQWKNSSQVISWFKNLQNKTSLNFFKFDVVAFYPSISEQLFKDTISWAKQYYNFSEDNLSIVMNARKSFLFSNSEPWTKKDKYHFDVTMGSYDGAEICELVGLFILSRLEDVIPQQHLGIYRDDGLAVVQGSGPELERLRKRVFAIFKNMDLKVKIETNIKQTDFLDILLNLTNNSYRPFRKENHNPIYINKASNHPPSIKKQLPGMISNRLSTLSCSKEVFLSEVPIYQDALQTAGFDEKLQFNENTSSNKSRTRSRKVIWFNPPFSQIVKTNVGAKFLGLVDKHFKDTPLGKYFNRSTIKISYSCLPNIEAIISGHNKTLTNPKEPQTPESTCNCRGGPTNCPMEGSCLRSSVVYKAEVKAADSTVTYLGAAANSFKERFRNHTLSFKHEKYKQNTSLSKYIWDLKTDQKPFEIKWSIAGRAPPYNPTAKSCKLCLLEKTLILTTADPSSLNKRSELMSKCRHRAKFLLSSFS
jgi:hypothetical protein